MTHTPPPIILSLIPCQKVIQNAQTGDYSIIETLAHIRATGFPCSLPLFAIFAEFTGGRGTLTLEFRVVDADDARAPVCTARTTGPVEGGPLRTAAVALLLPGITFPEPGEYRVQVWHEGALLRERKILLVDQSEQ
ncbi:MAG: DUF6941 family protein [Phycisphaerales bacterium JB039]